MHIAPVNPDRRPLPPGWQEHYEASKGTWLYICTNFTPPHVSEVHPLGPPTIPPPSVLRPLPTTPQNSQDMAFVRGQGSVPSPNIQASPLLPSQRLYASAVKSMPVPSMHPARSVSVPTPPPSPRTGSTQYPTHTLQEPQSYQPAQKHNMLVHRTHANAAGVPMLITKAEAPKDYKPYESDTRATPVFHTTAAPPPPVPPPLHISPPPATVTYPYSPNSTLNATSGAASFPVYQQLPPTPISPQNQGYTTAHHTGQVVPTPGLPIQVTAIHPVYQPTTIQQQQQVSYQPQMGYGIPQQQCTQQPFIIGHPQQQPSLSSQLVNMVQGALKTFAGGGGGSGGSTDSSSYGCGTIDPYPLDVYSGGLDPTSFVAPYSGGTDPTSFGGFDPSVYAGGEDGNCYPCQ
ncbi:hypothetical protein C0993_004705 [Termitomyces sp. T159_Od127]|nr:hypothetical protein C0993_004705 [Termitomyces sp. T159_Od127]